MKSEHAIRTTLLLLALAAAPTLSLAQGAGRTRKAPAHSYQAPFRPDVILLDAAHGGADAGGVFASGEEEKQISVSFARRLETLLTAKGFTVILTHADAGDGLSPEQRAELANRSRAVACLLLHATASGHGVHLFTSSLTVPSGADTATLDAVRDSHADTEIQPWDSAQAASLPRSLQLTNELATALNALRIPLVVARASVAPIDSLVCPAVAVEIAPPPGTGQIADANYQQQIAQALATALEFWRQSAQALIARTQPGGGQSGVARGSGDSPAASSTRSKSQTPATHIPDEAPLAPGTGPPPTGRPATVPPHSLGGPGHGGAA